MARKDRTGNRVGRDTFKKKSPALGKYIIYTDTAKTEDQYLYSVKDSLSNENQSKISIQVFQEKTENLVKACREDYTMRSQYCEPWIVFDRDQVPNFDKIIQDAKKNGIKVGWSNPCIEIWFGAYFGKMDNSWDISKRCCRKFNDLFKKKTGQEYKKSNAKNYELLKRYGDEEKAIRKAEQKLQSYLSAGIRKPSEMTACTTLHHLIGEIIEKGKAQ